MGRIEDLRAEYLNDPLTRGYSGLSQQAATDDINLLLYPGPMTEDIARAVHRYMLVETRRVNTGTDTVATPLWGRLITAASTPMGSDINGAASKTATAERVNNAAALLDVVRSVVVDSVEIDLTDDGADTFLWFTAILDGVVDAGVMGSGDRDAIVALMTGTQSRGMVLDIGLVRLGDTQQAWPF